MTSPRWARGVALGAVFVGLASLASTGCTACGSAHLAAIDAALPPFPPDAAPTDAEPPVPSDAASAPDAALVPLDAGPLEGCFDAPVEIWASSAGPTERAHARVLGAAASASGWIVLVTDLSGRSEIVFTDAAGAVRSTSELEVYGLPTRAYVADGSLWLFFSYEVQRFDIDASGITHAYERAYLALRSARAEGILAVEPLPSGEGFRALTLHYDTVGARYLLRASELRPDASAASGMTQAWGTLATIPDLDLANARYFLDDDHVRIFSRAGAWHVRDVQLGLGDLGVDGMVGVRVWSDTLWDAGPDQVLDMSVDRRFVLTARVDPETSAYLGHLEPLPPPAFVGPAPLGAGVPLGYGTPYASMFDDSRRVALATTSALGVFGLDGSGALREPTEIGTDVGPVVLTGRGEQLAVAYVLDTEARRIGLRCALLPSTP